MDELTNLMQSSIYQFKHIQQSPSRGSDWFVDVACDDMNELIDIQQFLERHYGPTDSVQSARDNLSCERNGADVRIWVRDENQNCPDCGERRYYEREDDECRHCRRGLSARNDYSQ